MTPPPPPITGGFNDKGSVQNRLETWGLKKGTTVAFVHAWLIWVVMPGYLLSDPKQSYTLLSPLASIDLEAHNCQEAGMGSFAVS